MGTELPERLFRALHGGMLAGLLTVGADGFAHAAYCWTVAPDRQRLRVCVDLGSSTETNLRRSAKAALQVLAGDFVGLLKGEAKHLAERVPAAPMKAGLWEMALRELRDQSWPGVALTPMAVVWPAQRRAAMEQMERDLYAQMREWPVG